VLREQAPVASKRARPAPPRAAPAQGALEEAQLISWPKPGKALLDTVLVLGIVAGTGASLFGVNVLLTDVFNWWYSH
jgi:preprotein translocase subunit SecE